MAGHGATEEGEQVVKTHHLLSADRGLRYIGGVAAPMFVKQIYLRSERGLNHVCRCMTG